MRVWPRRDNRRMVTELLPFARGGRWVRVFRGIAILGGTGLRFRLQGAVNERGMRSAAVPSMDGFEEAWFLPARTHFQGACVSWSLKTNPVWPDMSPAP